MRPISDLKSPGTDSVMQPASARNNAFEEDPHNNVAARSPLELPLRDQRPARFDRKRLLGDPRHPWAEVLDAAEDGFPEWFSVITHPTP